MELKKQESQPIVDLEHDERTLTDRRIRIMRDDPHQTARVNAYLNTRREHHNGFTYVVGACGGCGAAEVTGEGRPCVRRTSGEYGTRVQPQIDACDLCGFREHIDQRFVRLRGDSKKDLDAAGIPVPKNRNFVAVRFQGDGASLAHDFTTAIRRFDLGSFDPESDFEAIWIRALTIEDAAKSLDLETFDDSWWQAVPVDRHLRPTVRWVDGVRWSATDAAALEAVQRERRQEREKEIDREVARHRAELQAEARGLRR